MVNSGFGERVRQARELAGLGVGELAEVLGVHRSYLYRIETGKARNPSKTFINSLVAAVGVNPLWLISGDQTISEKESPEASSGQLCDAIQESHGVPFRRVILALELPEVKEAASFFRNLANGVEAKGTATVCRVVALELYAEVERREFGGWLKKIGNQPPK